VHHGLDECGKTKREKKVCVFLHAGSPYSSSFAWHALSRSFSKSSGGPYERRGNGNALEGGKELGQTHKEELFFFIIIIRNKKYSAQLNPSHNTKTLSREKINFKNYSLDSRVVDRLFNYIHTPRKRLELTEWLLFYIYDNGNDWLWGLVAGEPSRMGVLVFLYLLWRVPFKLFGGGDWT
jgi:hypothetical protein